MKISLTLLNVRSKKISDFFILLKQKVCIGMQNQFDFQIVNCVLRYSLLTYPTSVREYT